MKRVAFVVSEHRDGLTPARVARFARARKRLAEVATAEVDAIHYADVERLDVDATVLSGSYDPWALHDARALDRLGEALLAYEGPVLGICAGMQIQVRAAGGTIGPARQPADPGFAAVEVVDADGVLAGLPRRIDVYEEHTDEVTVLPDGLRCHREKPRVRGRGDRRRRPSVVGTQFHPEKWTEAQPAGRAILASFSPVGRDPAARPVEPLNGADRRRGIVRQHRPEEPGARSGRERPRRPSPPAGRERAPIRGRLGAPACLAPPTCR